MTKFILILVLASLACRMLTRRWPWQLIGRPANPAAAKARALLGVARDAGHGEIIDAHRRLIARVHPDRGGTNEQVHEANAARDLLLAALPERQ